MSTTTAEQTIAGLRRTLLLLANNQTERQQIEAAGRHLVALGAAMRNQDTERERQREDSADGLG